MTSTGILLGIRRSTGWRRSLLRLLAAAALLALLALLAWVAANRAGPRDYVSGLWPVGLGTAAVLVAPAAARTPVSLGVGAVAVLAVRLSEYPESMALGFGLVVAVEVWVAAAMLRHGDVRYPQLRTDKNLRRYFFAAILAACVGAAGTATIYAVNGTGHPGRIALSIGAAHLASQLFVVPLFLRLPQQDAIAGTGERVTQWVVILAGTPLLLVPDAAPSLAFLVIPILAWGALRVTPVESLVQLLAVVAIAIVLTTYGRGPFADVPERYGVPGELRGVLLSAFCASCAVIVVPLVLRVGEYVGAARAAAAERDLVRAVVDGATGVAIVGTDPRGRITLFNPGAERLLGYLADEVLGKVSTILHSRQAVTDKAVELGVADDFTAVTGAMVDRRLIGTPVRFLRRDGTERTHAMTLTRLTASGQTSGYVSTSEDVTDRLDTEQALREALETERQAVERLREVDAVKEQFISTVSHEIRTPITSILGYLEMLADGTLGELDGVQVDALHRVQSNSQRLLTLIDDLLTLSRFAEEGLRSRDLEFDLREAVRAGYEVVAPTWAPPRWLDASFSVPDDHVPIYGNRDMIERLVVNLVSNAVKFTDDGGAITVTVLVDTPAGQSVLRVADSGIGIPEAEQGQLFTRFFRSSLAEGRAIPGSGLGLAISRTIVEHHGGSIELTSRMGTGTKIDVRLPLRNGNVKDSTTVETDI